MGLAQMWKCPLSPRGVNREQFPEIAIQIAPMRMPAETLAYFIKTLRSQLPMSNRAYALRCKFIVAPGKLV
jgi:hypothetical protein